jgi:hypothetical protein
MNSGSDEKYKNAIVQFSNTYYFLLIKALSVEKMYY